jgi:hypothetical protein
VTITASGDLDPAARFFTRGGLVADEPGAGDAAAGGVAGGDAAAGDVAGGDPPAGGTPPQRLVYCADRAVAALRARLGGLAEVIPAGGQPRLGGVLADLAQRGVGRLMVEAGARLGAEFLTGGLADELQLVIAPFFVGDPAAPRFAGPGRYPAGPEHRLTLAEARPVGEVVLLRYICRNGAVPERGQP